MSANDLMVKISELPPLDYHDSSSLMAVVGRDRNSTGTGKVTIRKLRSTFDFSSAFADLPAGIAGTRNGESFFVYTDLSKSFVNEYINVSGSPSPVQDPVEGTIFYPTRYGIVNAMASGVTTTSFANLRKTRPAKNGASIYLTGYRDKETSGAGEFTGFLGTSKVDDGGMVAVGSGFYWVRKTEVASPEMFGAYGDGKNDDAGAIQRAMDTGLDVVFDKDGVYLVPRTLTFAWKPGKQTLDGRGCTINYGDKAKGLFNQYNSKGELLRYTINRNFKNFTLNGPATKDSAWLSVSSCDGIALQDGYVENVRFFGWCNATRGHGNAYIRNCYADNLRVAMFSCYDPGYNEIVDCDIGWCAGDGLILKGASAKAHNITFEYAGCITKNNEDGPEALPGCIFSAGADGEASATQKIQISNISCKYYGCAGINLQGDGISISGNMSLGSVYEGNFVARHQAAAMWLGCKNFSIGDIYFEKVHIGLGVNGNTNNGSIGRFIVRNKTNLAGSTLLSITDSPTSNINAVTVESFEYYGSSTINNDVYLNTEGLNIKYVYIHSLNNAQGGFTVSVRKACRIGKMILASTTSSAANPVMLVEGDAIIDHLEFRRVFGTALTVDNAKPIINKLTMPMKQGVMPPIVIKGDGSLTLFWGDVDINGPGVRWPIVNGKLNMTSYQGPNWRINDPAVYGGVSYPGRTASSFAELRMVGPVKDGDRITLTGYIDGSNVGNGIFEGKIGVATDDLGSIASDNKSFYWKRRSDVVNLTDYGIFLSNRTTAEYTDVADKFNSAARYAADNGMILRSPFVNTRNEYGEKGMYITKSVDISGCTVLDGDFHFIIKGNTFTARNDLEGLPYVLFNQNGQYDDVGLVFGTSKGSQDLGRITIYNADGANVNKPLNGQLHTFNGTVAKYLGAIHLNGTAVNLAVCFDSNIMDIRGLFSGNETQYGVRVAGYKAAAGSSPDESNALTIGGLMAHDCREKGFYVAGSKIRLSRVHEEATLVTVNSPNPTALEKRTTYNRMSSYFSSVGGSIGTLSVDASSKSTLPHVMAIGGVSTDVNEVYAPRSIVAVMSGDPGPWGASVGNVRSDVLNVVEGARATFQRINVTTLIGSDPDSKVNSGQIGTISNNIVSLSNCYITGAVNIVPTAITRYRECRFTLNPIFAGAMAYLDGCTFTVPLVTANKYRASFSNGRIPGVTLAGTDIDVRFNDIGIPGDYVQNTGLNGVWLLNNVQVDGNVTGWSLPNVSPWRGARTSNPRPGTTQDVDYVFTNDGWKPVSSRKD